MSFNLTDEQKKLLRKTVEYLKEGKVKGSLWTAGNAYGKPVLRDASGEHQIEFDQIYDLEALCDERLMGRSQKSKGYYVKQAGYDAVDTDFAAPDTSFITHLTPLADITNLDDEIKNRCLPILGAGSTDSRLWDSAVRTAGVILEQRLRDIGGITDPNRVGRDVVNDVFGNSGTLTSRFPVDAERQGYRDLYAGIVGAIRNPAAHRFIDPNPEDGGAVIVFVNLLLKMLEDLK